MRVTTNDKQVGLEPLRLLSARFSDVSKAIQRETDTVFQVHTHVTCAAHPQSSDYEMWVYITGRRRVHQVGQSVYNGEFVVKVCRHVLYHSHNFSVILKLFPNQKLTPKWSAWSMTPLPPSSPQAQQSRGLHQQHSKRFSLEGLLSPLHRILFPILRAHIVSVLTHHTMFTAFLHSPLNLFFTFVSL